MKKILVVDDDLIIHQMIKTYLPDMEVTALTSGEDAIVYIKDNTPDMILMDVQMSGMDGFETIEALNLEPKTKEIPIIFISTLDGDEQRLKAYGIGAFDYMEKPFNQVEFRTKVSKILDWKSKLEEQKNQLNENYQFFTQIQKNTALTHSISKFSQLSMFCHQIDNLMDLFLITTKKLQVKCVIKVYSDNEILLSNNGSVSQLEKEILEFSRSGDRIMQFGDNRAIFNWKNASLLVKNVDDLIDIIPLLMDAFDAAYESIDIEKQLVSNVHHLDQLNASINHVVRDIFMNLGDELFNSITAIGIVSELDIEEEEHMQKIIVKYQNTLNKQLSFYNQTAEKIMHNLNELQKVPEELKQSIENKDLMHL